MAEATALRNNALPYPVYGAPYTLVFPILDAGGGLVTGAAGLDSEVSKNGDTFADCTNEATEIATSSGMYYLTLTGTELTADVVSVIVKTTTTAAKTTPITLYPRKLVTLASGTSQGGAAGYITLAAGTVTFDDQYNGCFCVGVLDTLTEARILQDCTASSQQCTVTPSWNTTPDSDDTYIIYLPEGMQVPTANVIRITGTAQTGRDIGASVLLSAGTGTGQLDIASGKLAWNAAWDAEVQSEVNDELVLQNLDHLLKTATAGVDMTTEVTDGSIISRIISNSDTSLFVPATSNLTTLGANMVTIDDFVDTEVAALTTELAKVPKSDGTASWNATALAAINAQVVDTLTVDVIADSVAAHEARPTIAQALLMITRLLMEKSVSTTTVTVKKEDGSTSAMTFTLDDATNPTSITRAT